MTSSEREDLAAKFREAVAEAYASRLEDVQNQPLEELEETIAQAVESLVGEDGWKAQTYVNVAFNGNIDFSVELYRS